jgi:hypothetical protein
MGTKQEQRKPMSRETVIALTLYMDSPKFRSLAAASQYGVLNSNVREVFPDKHIPVNAVADLLKYLKVEYVTREEVNKTKSSTNSKSPIDKRVESQVRTLARAILSVVEAFGMYDSLNPSNLLALKTIAADYSKKEENS